MNISFGGTQKDSNLVIQRNASIIFHKLHRLLTRHTRGKFQTLFNAKKNQVLTTHGITTHIRKHSLVACSDKLHYSVSTQLSPFLFRDKTKSLCLLQGYHFNIASKVFPLMTSAQLLIQCFKETKRSVAYFSTHSD